MGVNMSDDLYKNEGHLATIAPSRRNRNRVGSVSALIWPSLQTIARALKSPQVSSYVGDS
jgi:hypothetical protein